MATREQYEEWCLKRNEAFKTWIKAKHTASLIKDDLGRAGELDCEGCGKTKATFCAGACGWFCSAFCHEEYCK